MSALWSFFACVFSSKHLLLFLSAFLAANVFSIAVVSTHHMHICITICTFAHTGKYAAIVPPPIPRSITTENKYQYPRFYPTAKTLWNAWYRLGTETRLHKSDEENTFAHCASNSDLAHGVQRSAAGTALAADSGVSIIAWQMPINPASTSATRAIDTTLRIIYQGTCVFYESTRATARGIVCFSALSC